MKDENKSIGYKHKEFLEKCGRILSIALAVERMLDFFIANYFSSPQSHRTFLLEDSILTEPPLGFGRKIRIFEEICKKENLEKEEFKGIVENAKRIKYIRNRVAHDERILPDMKEGTKLQRPKSVTYKSEELELTDELIRELDKKRLICIKGIAKIHSRLGGY